MKYVLCLLIIVVSLFAFAQAPPVAAASALLSGRKAPAFPLAVLQPVPFEFRGIRIGDEIKEAKRKFLSWKIPSPSSKPGMCGSDGINRIETCTDVLDTGQYVNMTMLDQKVAQIYVSTDSRTEGNTYGSYVLALAKEYGSPDKLETRQNRNGLVSEVPGGGCAGRRTANTSKPTRSNTPSPSGATHSMPKWTSWRRASISKPPTAGFVKVVGMHFKVGRKLAIPSGLPDFQVTACEPRQGANEDEVGDLYEAMY